MIARIVEDIEFRGQATFLDAILNAASVGNTQVKSTDPITADKLEHQHRATYAQESDTTAAAEDYVVHVVVGTTGEVQGFSAGCVVANVGAAVVTVDLHNNGASILTAAIDIDSGDAAYAVVSGTIDTAALAADDVLEVVVTVAAGGGTLGKGVFAQLDLFEDAD